MEVTSTKAVEHREVSALLGWVTESVVDPGNSGGHDTGGGRELIPAGRRTTVMGSHLPEQGC